jgi:hypothetical protein
MSGVATENYVRAEVRSVAKVTKASNEGSFYENDFTR